MAVLAKLLCARWLPIFGCCVGSWAPRAQHSVRLACVFAAGAVCFALMLRAASFAREPSAGVVRVEALSLWRRANVS